MTRNFSFYDDVSALERYINLPAGALANIPIYARVGAVDAILKVRDLEKASHFRPGLYYIVLADLKGNTAFNAAYGDAEGDVRVEWFQTCIIQSLGDIEHTNYAAYVKSIGDAALLIFSSFRDVIAWSDRLTANLNSMTAEYPQNMDFRGVDYTNDFDERLAAFTMSCRRLVHLGEVQYKDGADPICLAVSQTFKVEKYFESEELGCTQAVLNAVAPTLAGLNRIAVENKEVTIAGATLPTMTYYIVSKKPSKDNL